MYVVFSRSTQRIYLCANTTENNDSYGVNVPHKHNLHIYMHVHVTVYLHCVQGIAIYTELS